MSQGELDLGAHIDKLTFVCGQFEVAERFARNRGIPPEHFRYVQDWVNFAGYSGRNKVLWLVCGHESNPQIEKIVTQAKVRGWTVRHA